MIRAVGDVEEREASPPASFEVTGEPRSAGPFEVAEAVQTLPDGARRKVLLRRPRPALAERLEVQRALATATEDALSVAHQNVLTCHGLCGHGPELVQVSEAPPGLDLAALIARARRDGTPFPVALAVWIGREIAAALLHASSLGVAHGDLAPGVVYATMDGAIQVDFGASRGRSRAAGSAADRAHDPAPGPLAAPAGPAPHADVRALAAILFELLTLQGPGEGDHRPGTGTTPPLRALRPDAPAALELLLLRALEHPEPLSDPRATAAALDRAFYVDLDGDDARDGSGALIAHLARGAPGQPAPLGPPDPAEPTGSFTRALEQREGPVSPRTMELGDRDAGPFTVANPGTPPAPPGPTRAPPSPPAEPEVAREPPREVPPPRWRWVWFGAGFVLALAGILALELSSGPGRGPGEMPENVSMTATSTRSSPNETSGLR